ncbi:SIALI-17 repeat-containing surface protein [Streptococcus infantis]|uniref:SIALI-17 repeat-containing surface protein n=1 Tax=Streptococcus infantis TaxID=68892 RepID=UPI0039C2E379
MKHQFYGEKRQRFSFRKLSVGLISATIGSFFLGSVVGTSTQPVEAAELAANQAVQIQYKYVIESELTDAENAMVVKELPKFVEESTDAYYLVYRPKKEGRLIGNLPSTGYSGIWEAIFATAGIVLAVLVISKGKNGKRYLSSILLVTGLGSILLSPSILAVTNIELAAYNQLLNLGLGEQLPQPLNIENFEYIGYLKSQAILKNSLEQGEESKHKANQTVNQSVDGSENDKAVAVSKADSSDKSTDEKLELVNGANRVPSGSSISDRSELQLSSQDESQTQVLPYQTEYRYSDNLVKGQTKTIQVGVSGERTVITRRYSANQKVIKSELVFDQVTVQPISEIILVGTAESNQLLKESPVHDLPEYPAPVGTAGTDPAPVHEVPEYTDSVGTVGIEPALVHEVPAYTESVGTVGTEPVPVHDVPEYTDSVGTSGDEPAPVHDVPEYTESVGTAGDAPAPVHDLPEYTDPVGTSGVEPTPVHEVPEYTELVGTAGADPAPVYEIPEYTESVGTSGVEPTPVHEVPEYTESVGTTGEEPALVHDVPEYTELIGTSGYEPAPVHEVPEYIESVGTVGADPALVYEVPEYPDPVGTAGAEPTPVHELPEYTDQVNTVGSEPVPVHEVPEYIDPVSTVGSESAPVHEVLEYTDPVGTAGDESAPVHELPEYTDPVGIAGEEPAPVHDVPEYTESVGTAGADPAPVYEIPEYTESVGTSGVEPTPVHEVPEYTDPVGTAGIEPAPVHDVPEYTESVGTSGDEPAPVHEIPAYTASVGTAGPEPAPVHEVPAYTDSVGTVGTEPVPVHEVPEYTESVGTAGTEPAPVHEVPEYTDLVGTAGDEPAPVHEVPAYTDSLGTVGTEPVPVHEVPEYTDPVVTVGDEPAPVHYLPEYTESVGTVGPEPAPVHEVPAYTSPVSTVGSESAPVHEVPEYTESVGTAGDEPALVHYLPEYTDPVGIAGEEPAPVHEVPAYTDPVSTVGSEPAPVHEVPEYTESVGTAGDEPAPVHELPEYTASVGTVGTEPTPVHEVPAYTAPVGTAGDEPAPVHESPEYTEPVGTTGDNPVPVHELPEYTESVGTAGNDPAPVHEVPEYTAPVGTAGDAPAPVYDLPEYTEPVGTAGDDPAPVHELPEYTESVGTTGDNPVPVHELPEYTESVGTAGNDPAPVHEVPEYTAPVGTVGSEPAPVYDLPEYTEPVGTAGTEPTPSFDLPELELSYVDETRVEKVAFKIEEQYTDELVKDSRIISVPGVEGERTIRTRVYYSNNQELDRQELSNEETLPPVTQIVKIGTASPFMIPNDAPKVEALDEFDLIPLYNLLSEADQVKSEARYFNDISTRQISYDSALLIGQELLTRSEASQDQVNQAVASIENAKEQLQGPDVTKVALQTEYRDSQDIQDSFKYKNADSDKKTNFTREFANAETVLANRLASQVQVDQALANLTAARTALNGVAKVRPNLSILSLTENPEDRSVTVQYNLTDETQSLRTATAELYEGDQLVRSLPITNFAGSLKIGDLDHYTNYTLKTKLTYELDQGQVTDFEKDSRQFELEYKKISIRNVEAVEFYSKENDQYKRLISMNAVPNDLSNYFVKVKSAESKEMLLPVQSIAESTKDGREVYKVTVSLPELVQESETGYKPGYDFYISKSHSNQQGVYTSFASLLEAMKSNMAGNYVLGADLDASEVSLAASDYVYLRNNFTGSLTGSHNGKQYAIYNLAKPLFENLKSGARISNIDLKDVNIVGTYDSASLARSAENAHIQDVSAQGRVAVVGNASQVAGLVVVATNTQITNSSFTGTIQTNDKQSKAYNVGGLVANLKGNASLLTQSRADVTILASAKTNEQRFGGLVGRLEANARITNSYASGKIQNSTKNGQIGGVVGSNYYNGLIDNVLSNVSGSRVYSISGDQGYKNDRITNAYAVEGIETLAEDPFASSKLSLEQAQDKLGEFGITTSLDDTNLNLYAVDYSKAKKVDSNRTIAYLNMEKLLPFYNKETIVAYANKLAEDHKLNTSYLLDVVPMKDQQIITDIHGNKTGINRLMLHYEDNTIQYLEVTYKGDFKNKAIAEYTIKDLNLLYTPEAFLSDYSKILTKVLPELNKVVLDSAAVRTVLGINAETSLDDLYLDKAFDQVKANLSVELRKVLAMDKSINTEGTVVADYIAKKITDNKEAFLVGLTYLNRWYNINYDTINVKDLSAYKFDFFGNNDASTLDTIIALGRSGFENLKAKNTYQTYDTSLSEATGKRGLFNYLESYRNLFLPYKTNNEWLKDNTKAYIIEAKSDIAEAKALQDNANDKSKYSVGVYDKITSDSWEHKGMLLPLLTMTEKGVYIISNMSTISMGAYDRYRDIVDGKVRTDAELASYVEDRVRKSAEWQRDHYDFWYKILSDESKDKLFRSVLVYDGFALKDKNGQRYWAQPNDKQSNAMQEFFGPAGKWYPSKGYNAYATGSVTHFDNARLLEDYGNSVYTHEMTHNSDGAIYFEGFGRREGLGAELYARGLLQSTPSPDEATITLNTLFKVDKDSKTRLHTYNFKERVQNEADLKDYVHGMFDMIYTLDYLEASSILKQTDEAKMKWFRKMENYYITDKYGKQTHAGNQTRTFTAEEIKKLKTFESLIDNDVITRRENKDSGKYARNGYLSLSLFSPIYSALSNPTGAPGDVMFRRTAYELLAAKGYHEGFIPYVSGKLSEEALKEGSTTWDGWLGRDVGLVTDQKVLENVFKGEYHTWAAFKKAMYQERIDKLTKLKPITIEYELRNPNSTKQVTIRSYKDMQRLMDEATAEDVRNIDNATSRVEASWVNLLKKKIYNAYLRTTDDFRQSIFTK